MNKFEHVSIVYDGQCPVCSRLAAASRLRERTARLDLVDARAEAVDSIQGRDLSGVDFDQGFAVVVDGKVHLGADGAHVLAVLTEPSGLFYRLFQWLVGGERRSRAFYPVLRAGRNLLLRILRIPRFSDSGGSRKGK